MMERSMPRVSLTLLLIGLALAAGAAYGQESRPPEIQKLLDGVGIPPAAGVRGQADTVGFVTTAQQMDAVLAQSANLADARDGELVVEGWSAEVPAVAAVCPHDDYYYAGRLYALLAPRMRARTVVLFGVFHKASVFGCRDRLVFDSFRAWRGPYGPVAVSPIREEILSRLPSDDYLVNNDMQQVEHSVEAIVPWLQAGRRDVEIVSILVPYMDWATMDRLAVDLSSALAEIARERGWVMGRDLCLVASTDAVHYGDSDWGGRTYAEFGVDAGGHMRAWARDRELAESLLCGPVRPEQMEKFLYRCVDRADVTQYRITWCGRFSVPFGLNVAARLMNALEMRPLMGKLLDYGTSVSEASLDVSGLGSLGPTAPNNFHHFVGYAAVAYQ